MLKTGVFDSAVSREPLAVAADAGGMCIEGVGYLAVHEAMLAQIRASPGRAFTCFRFLPFYRDAFRVVALRKTPDEIAEMNGWRFHTDGVHLNSRGGMIVADLVQGFIDR